MTDAPREDAGPFAERLRPFAGAVFAVVALCAAGAVAGPLTEPASRATHPRSFSFATATPGEAASEGFLVSLGGLRTLAADAVWLRAYVMWEKRDRGACAAYARLAGALAPGTPYFREGYANWLAYDFPYWTIERLGGLTRVSDATRDALFKADAREALAYLEHEMKRDPEESRYPFVASQIVTIRLKDLERAADYDRRAAETPAGPWPQAIRYANHLAETGRMKEAMAWMSAYAARRPQGTVSRAEAEQCLALMREASKTQTK